MCHIWLRPKGGHSSVTHVLILRPPRCLGGNSLSLQSYVETRMSATSKTSFSPLGPFELLLFQVLCFFNHRFQVRLVSLRMNSTACSSMITETDYTKSFPEFKIILPHERACVRLAGMMEYSFACLTMRE